MATEQQKRRVREEARKLAAIEQKQREEVFAARVQAREQGAAEGRAYGAKVIRAEVLAHAGRLFTEGKDDAAIAVRNVHRVLSVNVL